MSKPRISRREFLRLTTFASAAAVMAACAPAVTQTAAPAATKAPVATAAPASKYKEAPMLAELVKAGKLPAVDQRLPANPLVVKPIETDRQVRRHLAHGPQGRPAITPG